MKNKIIILLSAIILLMLGYLIYQSKYEPEDVNRDGQVDSLDLLIVRKKLISNMESEMESDK